MPLQSNSIFWVAGILEGEATFCNRKDVYPQIRLGMCDLDIVQRVRNIMNPSAKIHPRDNGSNHRVSYDFRINGQLAAEWMMTIYTLMGIRRKEKIREILQAWKTHVPNDKVEGAKKGWITKRESKIIELIMMSRNVSREEAIAIYEDSLTSTEKTNAPTIQ